MTSLAYRQWRDIGGPASDPPQQGGDSRRDARPAGNEHMVTYRPVAGLPFGGDVVERTRIGEFTDLAVIGRGGQGTVYRARRDSVDGLTVAIKVYATTLDGDAARRFHREVAALLALRGEPHIAWIVQADFTDTGQPYVATELYRESLADRLDRTGPLPVGEALGVGAQVAAALHAAHQRPERIIHRDVKPSNLLVDARGRVVLGDFGIAAISRRVVTRGPGERGDDLTATARLGTPGYVAPEVARGEDATERSDVYALGATILRLLGGDPRREDGLRVLAPVLPRSVVEVLAHALRPDPAERYPSAGRFREALLAAQQQLTRDEETTVAVAAPADTVVDPVVPAAASLPVPLLRRPVPDRDDALPRRLARYGAGWLFGTAVLTLAGWPWWATLLAVLAGVGLPAYRYQHRTGAAGGAAGGGVAGGGAGAREIAAPGIVALALGYGAYAAVSLSQLGNDPFPAAALLAVAAVSYGCYVTAAVSAARLAQNRDAIAAAETENARRLGVLRRFLPSRCHVADLPEPWLLYLVDLPTAWIFQLEYPRFRYAVVRSRTVLLVSSLPWRPGRYRVDGDTVSRGGAICRPELEQLRYLAAEGRRCCAAMPVGTPGGGAQVYAVVVVTGPDGRGGQVTLPPAVFADSLLVVAVDDAEDHLKRVLTDRDPDGAVDVDVLLSVSRRAVAPPSVVA